MLGEEPFWWEGWETQAEIRKEPSKPSVTLLGKRVWKMGKAM